MWGVRRQLKVVERPGRYRIVAREERGVGEATVEVGEGPRLGVVVALRELSGSIVGRLLGLDSEEAAAVTVSASSLEGREWVALDRPTIADLSIAGYIYYGEELPFDLSDYPNVDAWKDRLAALPGWKPPYELMPLKG